MNVRFCWRYEPSFFPLKDSPGRPSAHKCCFCPFASPPRQHWQCFRGGGGSSSAATSRSGFAVACRPPRSAREFRVPGGPFVAGPRSLHLRFGGWRFAPGGRRTKRHVTKRVLLCCAVKSIPHPLPPHTHTRTLCIPPAPPPPRSGKLSCTSQCWSRQTPHGLGGCASGCTWSTARATARLRDGRPPE